MSSKTQFIKPTPAAKKNVRTFLLGMLGALDRTAPRGRHVTSPFRKAIKSVR